MIGMTLSGAVLLLTVAPAFRNDKKQVETDAKFLKRVFQYVREVTYV